MGSYNSVCFEKDAVFVTKPVSYRTPYKTSLTQQRIGPSTPVIDQTQSTAQKIAMTSLKEFGVSLAMVGVMLPFVTTVGAQTLLAHVVVMLGVNTLSRFIEVDHKQEDPSSADLISSTHHIFRSTLFYLLSFDILVHESGHALATLALYQNPRPKITIMPYEGGVTSWYPGRLSKLGAYFGEKPSRLIVSGAGAGLALAFYLGCIMAAYKTQKSNPEASSHLLLSSYFGILQHVVYALSALSAEAARSPGHDFVALARGGIHPLAAAAFLILVPATLCAGLYLFDTPWEKEALAASPKSPQKRPSKI